MSTENAAHMWLTIRYVVDDDTFAVVDTAQHDRVVQGGFKKSSQAQWFADQLIDAQNRNLAAKKTNLQPNGSQDPLS
jgi:hypothetical protein